jgi:hypothetical protein
MGNTCRSATVIHVNQGRLDGFAPVSAENTALRLNRKVFAFWQVKWIILDLKANKQQGWLRNCSV